MNEITIRFTKLVVGSLIMEYDNDSTTDCIIDTKEFFTDVFNGMYKKDFVKKYVYQGHDNYVFDSYTNIEDFDNDTPLTLCVYGDRFNVIELNNDNPSKPINLFDSVMCKINESYDTIYEDGELLVSNEPVYEVSLIGNRSDKIFGRFEFETKDEVIEFMNRDDILDINTNKIDGIIGKIEHITQCYRERFVKRES